MTLCVCLSAIISLELGYTSDLHQIFMHIIYVRGSVLLWWCCDMLCTSGSMDGVICAHNGVAV